MEAVRHASNFIIRGATVIAARMGSRKKGGHDESVLYARIQGTRDKNPRMFGNVGILCPDLIQHLFRYSIVVDCRSARVLKRDACRSGIRKS